MVILSLLFHIPVLYLIGSGMAGSPSLGHVEMMDPAPDAVLDVKGDEPIVVNLRVLARDARADPMGATLSMVDEEGVRTVVAVGALSRDGAYTDVRFVVGRAVGEYEVRLSASGLRPFLSGGYRLDGEFSGAWPSGDGEVGGDFIAPLRVEDIPREPEKMQANIVAEQSVPDEAEAVPEEEAAPLRLRVAETVSDKPSTPIEVIPVPKSAKWVQPIVEQELPMERPDKAAEISDLFDLETSDLDLVVGEKADKMAKELTAKEAREGLLGGWEESLEQTRSTFNGDGPKVKAGNQKAVRTHTKEVWAYIALMHKRIHKQWADEYLIGLDLKHRSPTSPLNDPQLKTVLELELDQSGKITDVQVVNTSGVLEFDAEAIRISWEAGPSEPVPASMLSSQGKSYLHWTYWRDQHQCGTFGVSVFVLEDGVKSQVSVDHSKVEAEEARIGVREGSVAPGIGGPTPQIIDEVIESEQKPRPQSRKRGQ
ncbi:MAG: hypothetical protein AUK47_22065 [Deltaproteobacteria bacterium CG2_30_63_29]|nr:MAG: hypothetical protein AUK47_22065 [Deltaproteobacteria bacterium CG2_30_63_29]